MGNAELRSDISVDQLQGMGRWQPAGVASHEYYVTKDGKVYVRGIAECQLPVALFPVYGFFKTGAEAATLMETASSTIVPYAIEPQTKVLLQPKPGSELPACLAAYENSSVEFQKVLQDMTLAGLAKPDLHLHSVQSHVDGADVKWRVASQEKACLKANAEEPPEGNAQFPPAELTRVSPYIDISKLTKVSLCFKLQFDTDSNKFKGMLPWACLQQETILKKDVVAQL